MHTSTCQMHPRTVQAAKMMQALLSRGAAPLRGAATMRCAGSKWAAGPQRVAPAQQQRRYTVTRAVADTMANGEWLLSSSLASQRSDC